MALVSTTKSDQWARAKCDIIVNTTFAKLYQKLSAGDWSPSISVTGDLVSKSLEIWLDFIYHLAGVTADLEST